MAIKFVRKPSETPNIKNTDDFVGLRYAYGNQNGYVIGKGSECSYSINGTTFKINSCRLVLQGVEVDIDSAGVSLTITDISSKRYFTAYLQVSLATNSAEIKLETSQVNYPVISAGDDLNVNTSGTARMELYRFTATGSVISDVQKVVNKVKYIEDFTVNNAKKVNNLEIKQDANSVVKIGEEILPKKKLLWSSDIGASSIEQSGFMNKNLEIWLSSDDLKQNMKIIKTRFSPNSSSGVSLPSYYDGIDWIKASKVEYFNMSIHYYTIVCKDEGIGISGTYVDTVKQTVTNNKNFKIYKIYEIVE